jgi:hypothetical protein
VGLRHLLGHPGVDFFFVAVRYELGWSLDVSPDNKSSCTFEVPTLRQVWQTQSNLAGLQASGLKEVKLLMNKAATKTHERLVRERAKARGDDRDLRMQALKANDMAAYQEMLRAQVGSAAAQDARCVLLGICCLLAVCCPVCPGTLLHDTCSSSAAESCLVL